MPTLRKLQAQFVCNADNGRIIRPVKTLAEAHGVMYLCPLCWVRNRGPVGTHMVLNWFEDRVPDDLKPGPGRWKPVGKGLDDLTFVVGKRSNSVLLTSGCRWHGFVANGRAE